MKVDILADLIVLRNHALSLLNGIRTDLKLTHEQKSQLVKAIRKSDDVFLEKFSDKFIEQSLQSKVEERVLRTAVSTHSESEVLGAFERQEESAKVQEKQLQLFDKQAQSGAVLGGEPEPQAKVKKQKKNSFSRADE
jgi:hypothetical protein